MNKLIKIFGTLLIFSSSIVGQDIYDIFPIELLYFEASLTEVGVLLRWGTATEVNNYGFEIQRADSSLHFLGIDFMPGSGNSNSPKHYFYIDSSLTDYGIYYYRLKQIDNDGTFNFSDTVHIIYQPTIVETRKSKNQTKVFVTNNIKLRELTINLMDEIKDEIVISVFTLTGQKILEKSIYPDNKVYRLDYKNFSSGIYFLILNSRNKIISTYKFIAVH